jgi:uncharacterized protein YyaL (SSP411 family)
MPSTLLAPAHRLEHAASVHLRAHAAQPVAWYPWGTEALEAAITERKPIFLSIGYSACHWCHLMAQESFSDAKVAAVLNDRFVCVKVDRDERPDLDRVYQLALQALTQEPGGWPLNVFLTPDDSMPFFGGTYFPAAGTGDMPGFADLLTRLADYHAASIDTIREQHAQLRRLLAPLTGSIAQSALPSADALPRARQQLALEFDALHGGFGSRQKLLQPGFIERLLRHWSASQMDASPDLQALYMASLTLTRMAESGVHDQVDGGFFRQSTDRGWMIPRFEKRLVDSAWLLGTYAQAAIATGEPLFAQTATRTADWILRVLRQPGGAFAASVNPDFTTTEGQPFLWSQAEIEQTVPLEALDAFRQRFGLHAAPNAPLGHWHLHAQASWAEVAERTGVSALDCETQVDGALAVLRERRSERSAFLVDPKVIVASNALAIRHLAIAGRLLGREDYVSAAHTALTCVRAKGVVNDRLKGTVAEGGVGPDALVDDYALLLEAVLALLEAQWDTDLLHFARWLADTLLTQFQDPASGGLWLTAHEAEALIFRPQWFADESTPSGNGAACRALLRLSVVAGEPRYATASRQILCAAAAAMESHLPSHATLLDALEETLAPLECIVLRGPRAVIAPWSRELARLYAPNRMVMTIPDTADALPQWIEDAPATAKGRMYVCRDGSSVATFEHFSDLVRHLRQGLELEAD